MAKVDLRKFGNTTDQDEVTIGSSMAIPYKPICQAIAQGNVEVVRREIESQPGVVKHWKPLCDAAFYGNVDCVKLLLDGGADPNQVAGTAARHTPLTRIAQYHKTIPKQSGHFQAMRLLLDRGADPAIPAGPLHLTPLAYSCFRPEMEFVAILKNQRLHKPAHIAAVLCDLKQLQGSLDGIESSDLVDRRNRTPLHYVAMSGMWRELGSALSIECASLLINKGLELDAIEEIPDGGEIFLASPLWYAVAWSQNIKLIEFLLERGANPTPTAFAASFGGDLNIVTTLNEYGCDWNSTFEGRTPLHELLMYRRTRLVRELIEFGASVDARDSQGRTPLHYAANYGLRREILELLLEHGADCNSQDDGGSTPFDLAKKAKKAHTVEFLSRLQ